MGVYRSCSHMKVLCDLLVAQALAKGLKHLALPGGQLVDGELRLAIALALASYKP